MWAPELRLPIAVAGPAFLRDGTEVWVRPVRSGDRELVHEFVNELSLDALALRFFAAVRPSVAEEEVFAPDSADDRLCLLVLGERSGRVTILGIGEYARMNSGSTLAEVAFLVAERFRRRGIASLLLARLARAAGASRIVRFVAHIRAGNPEALEVFRASGLPYTLQQLEDGVDVVVRIAGNEGSAGVATLGPV
jgi:GNAT superfamily N-acetyltransferase